MSVHSEPNDGSVVLVGAPGSGKSTVGALLARDLGVGFGELLELPGVLALGGGAVLSPTTRAALRGRRVVWLRIGLSQSVKRVGLDTARPLLLGNVRGRLLKLLNERAALYAEVATEVVDTDHTTPAEVVETIMNAHAAHR